ncbi:MAG TPA: RsmE family RNA methyltransferase [Phycisphaerae bacterium]|jgi:16S rRNA (uracil1498-N3)-methyltransferase|nr:16S rRNA (uracil(1498)-N(3))-methyltransferase [Phycisphaerae bacterium]HOB76272.1 RsmE family RNA methyltransferase [Phycisphaerae bacterium]HOJ53666.1 RsmE family RNA methyltransferase [Phycisphaerae bacterium]HOL26391.1 RsmE family RNA methyltransferase [Phycisphaerae bacterium]HPP21101.1 RsmE family RNA methyltransferase [Phycisphaerae bacterium]
MGTPRFHVERLTGPTLRLSGPEAVHAVRSRRLAAGEEVVLFDGAGHEAAGQITAVGRSELEVTLGAFFSRPRPTPALTLAVALPKGPRQDVLIEKCTELGTAAIVPLISARSISSASEHKLDRWRRTTIEAAKQSGQAWLPEFFPPEPLAEALRRIASHDLAVVAATEQRSVPFSSALSQHGTSVVSILAFVGPEGGWTPEELDALTAHGCQPISLGPNILRIETAAIALAAIVHVAQGAAEHKTENNPEASETPAPRTGETPVPH